ncbi:MAG: DUF2478 domain-containing protein [Xanthobacteraceae bacterium]|nr:MAG: DUF2478 domain-containing protein [Xanthobacteraceae bacterium]
MQSETAQDDVNQPVLAVKGTSAEQVREVLVEISRRLVARGVRVAGVIEVPATVNGGPCGHVALRDIVSGKVFSLSQELGSGSTSCNLDSSGLAGACGAVERAIRDGADLVILSKFGKQEAERGGLSDAFRAALLAGLPVLTSVSPAVTEVWQQFAGPLADDIAADVATIEAWWQRHAGAGSGTTH